MKQVTLGEISLVLTRGKAPQYDEKGSGRIVKSAQVQPKAVLWNNCPNVSDAFAQKFKKNFALRNDDILLNGTGTGTLGRPGFVSEIPAGIYVPDSHVNLIRVDESKAFPKFVFHWLNSPSCQKKIALASTGSTNQIELSAERLSKIKVPFPSLAQQIHIAQVLDQADRLRQQDRQLLAHYDQLVQAVFIDMFGSANQESKDWPEVRIADLANNAKNSMRTGPFGSDLLHSEFVDEGIFVLGIDNVVNNSFEWARPRFITAEKYEKLKRYTVFPGDVLISIMATIGRTAVVPDDVPAAINSKHLAAITLNQSLAIPEFISYSLYSDPKILRQLASRSKGAIMDGLNLGIIKDTKLNLPPLELQKKFANIMRQVEVQKAVTQQLQSQSESLFNSLLQQAFRGELTRLEPAAGPAAGQLSLALK